MQRLNFEMFMNDTKKIGFSAVVKVGKSSYELSCSLDVSRKKPTKKGENYEKRLKKAAVIILLIFMVIQPNVEPTDLMQLLEFILQV